MKKHISTQKVPYAGTLGFGRNQQNREINRGHLQKMKVQCITSLETMPPIVINVETNNIIDGQHRLKAFQSLVADGSLPETSVIEVKFVSIPIDEEKASIIDANTNSKNWSLDNYISSYVKEGAASYAELEEWCDSHHLCYSYVRGNNGQQTKRYNYRYAAAIITGKHCINELKTSKFTFTKEMGIEADQVHTEMVKIIELFGLKGSGAWIEALAVAWSSNRNKCPQGMLPYPFKTWMKELKIKKARFAKMPKTNTKEWDTIFSAVLKSIIC